MRRGALALVVALAVLAGTTSTAGADAVAGRVRPRAFVPQPSPEERAAQPRPFGASVWMPWWLSDEALRRTVAGRANVRYASPFWYDLQLDGSLRPWINRTMPTAELHKADLPVVPAITAVPLRVREAADRFSDPAWSDAVRARLVALVVDERLEGIDLDFESFLGGTFEERCRLSAAYVAFVEGLARDLHARGRLLIVSLLSRSTEPSRCANGLQPTLDYPRLGRAADVLRLMTYNYSYGGGPPGPIAPVAWVDEVLRYVVTKIDRRKVELGIATYGRSWAADGTSDQLRYDEAVALSNGEATFNSAHKEMTWKGTSPDGVQREIWFEDARAVAARTELARRYGLAGVSLWAIGYEDPLTLGTFS